MRVKRGIYNIIFGILGKVITIAIGLIIPRLFIINLGSESNGLMSSISQIFVYMGLLEAGIGSVSTQALYDPISKKDNKSINKILSATAIYYKKAGIYYLVCVGIIGILYPLIVKTTINKIDVFLVILFTGLVGTINFLFQGKYKVLLIAEGKSYITSNIVTLIGVLSSISKVILILNGFDIVAIQFSYFLIGLLQILLLKIYIKKNYKWINTSVEPNYNAISQKNSAFIHQISAIIFANTDILIITIFCGLKVASIYSLYNLIITYVSSILGEINTGIVFILGQTYYENKEYYKRINNVYENYYMAITFAIYTVTFILFLPFMKLYTRGISEINYVDSLLPPLFILIQLLSCGRAAANNAINVAGYFKKTQNRSIIEACINIVISLICVNLFGIYGVLIGTIAALLYRVNDIIIYSCKNILHKSTRKTYFRWIINLVIMVSIINIVDKFNITINTYAEFVHIGIVLSISIIPAFIIIDSIFNKECFYFVKNYIKVKLNERFAT